MDARPTTPPPAPGEHGGDGRRVAAALGLHPASVVDLSASLNPVAPDVAEHVAAAVASGAAALDAYPDDGPATEALADAIGVEADRLVLTNGGAEAIALVAAELRRGRVDEPEFSLYRRHLDAVDEHAPRWRSNPSNPLGRLAPPGEGAAVWDEAFFPLATGRWSRGDEGSWRLGSLTKLWRCPGLRIGYAIAPDAAAASRLLARRPRWSVGAIEAAVVRRLLPLTDLPGWAERVAALRAAFAAELRGLGLDVTDTDANWVLVHDPGLRDALAARGVVVRDASSFGLPGVHRVAVPRPADLDRVLGAVAAVAGRVMGS